MTHAKHTPGPWRVELTSQGYAKAIVATDKSLLHKPGGIYWITRQNALSGPSSAEGMANAWLMAAAPELYAALKDALDELEASGLAHDHPSLLPGRAALAKVTGD